GDYLVVARARRVQLAPHRPGDLGEPPLDRQVDVLIVHLDREAPLAELALDAVQAREKRIAILRADDAPLGEHPRVRARLCEVLRPEPAIEGDRGVQPLEVW